MNGHWATSPSMMSQPSVALVRRKGSCVRWSDKIAHVQYLSAEYNLQITSIVIYDNILYNDTQFISESTDDADYPTFTDPLPSYRDIQFMTEENTLDLGSTFVAVYFVPLSYIQYLNQTLIQRTFEPNGTRQVYTQLTFSLSEHYFPPSNTTQTNEDDAWNREREKRNYIIYAITAGVVLILVFFVIRWCLAFRIQEDQVERGESLLLRDIRDHVIAFDDLERLCPVLRYGDTSMTNTVCAICLDEFLADFFVRVLPCHHGYCTACIGN
ncbi:uncharacterized protein B0P05DRAFT_301115 [Gilbertella persicaria]|uniref:uncharacterized protein n=1 Tax=Gilbertella persicaria TaxID=101096 RepID=UPI00221F61C7|nr:uncharacterized protein B0P05DRAFT_301115 [Gilbertella persicaria]KAI8091137.1 hypothetical protein B0P05DRAFT_301115 [Gilbertella persicaria]